MIRRLLLLFGISVLPVLIVAAQDKSGGAPEGNTVCTLQDGKQVSIRYSQVPYNRRSELPVNRVGTPGNQPMYLFSQADLTIGDKTVPPGAYSFYVMPGKSQWTMIVNRDVKEGGKYDSAQDVARTAADVGELPSSVPVLTLYFGMTGPKTCALRFDYGKTRAFADFTEK